jgi:hypothetical protein
MLPLLVDVVGELSPCTIPEFGSVYNCRAHLIGFPVFPRTRTDFVGGHGAEFAWLEESRHFLVLGFPE